MTFGEACDILDALTRKVKQLTYVLTDKPEYRDPIIPDEWITIELTLTIKSSKKKIKTRAWCGLDSHTTKQFKKLISEMLKDINEQLENIK